MSRRSIDSLALAELGVALRQARIARGWSQTGLEWVAGVDQTVISRVERGVHVGLRLSTFIRLLDALEVVRVDFRVRHGVVPDYTLEDLGRDHRTAEVSHSDGIEP